MPEREQKPEAGAQEGAQARDGAAFEPASPDAAQGQAAELTAAAEKKRLEKAEADWKTFLGDKLGAKAFEKIHELVGFDALQGHAKKAVESMGKSLADGPFKATEEGKLGGLMDEAAEAEALNKLVAAVEPELRAAALKWLEGEDGQKLLRAVSSWTEEHPKTTTVIIATVLLGGAVAAYLANLEIPEIKQTFKLGKGLELTLGAELGRIQELALEAVTVKLKYETDGLQASLTGLYSAEDGVSVRAGVSASGEIGATKLEASADVTVGGEDELVVGAKGELQTVLSETPVSASAGASHSAKDDKTALTGTLTVGETGETRSLSGTYTPQDDSFKLTLGRTTDGGRVTRATSVGQDGEGQLTSEERLTYKADDQVSLEFASGQVGDTETTRFGLALDLDDFEAKLDYEMEGARESLGLRSAYEVDSYRFSLDGKVDLTDRRLSELGGRVGWRDPKEFKSWSLGYRAKLEGDDPSYVHTFDTVLEYSLGSMAGRFEGDLSLDDQGMKDAEAQLLLGREIGDSGVAVLGVGTYETQRRPMGGGYDSDLRLGVGVEYKGVGVTVDRGLRSGDSSIQLHLKLFSW